MKNKKLKNHKKKKINIEKLHNIYENTILSINKYMKMKNGNIKTQLKILSWNKGNNDAINAKQKIINKPNILSINELNLNTQDEKRIMNIEGYKLELDQCDKNTEYHRTGLYIKDNKNYEREKT